MENKRKLASIQKILSVSPIQFTNSEGVLEVASNIVLVTIQGWQSVTQVSNNFKVGDLVVYFEIDSVFPQIPKYEFLEKVKYRIKTIKLKGYLSQGLVLPLSVLETDTHRIIDGKLVDTYSNSEKFVLEEGCDVTEYLGIVKYEIPESNSNSMGLRVRNYTFPNYIPKTDEERVQNSKFVVNYLQGKPYYISLKYDGSSCTTYYNNGEFGVCSRNYDLDLNDENAMKNKFCSSVIELGIKDKISEYCINNNRNLAFQGELVGPGIQNNRLGLKTIDYFVFNVFDIDNNKYLDYKDFLQITKDVGLNHVEILEESSSFDYSLEQLLDKAKGTYSSGYPREGIVIRPQVESFLDRFGRVSFKVINNDFLLKSGG